MSDTRNRCYSKAGLAEGTSAAKFKILAPNGAGIDYSIKGVMYHKADTDDLSLSTGTTITGPAECIFGILIDSSGNVTSVQGPIKTIGDDSKVLAWPPSNDDDKCLIGGIVVSVADTYSFIPNTTDLGATGITDTYVDCDGLPPQAVNLV